MPHSKYPQWKQKTVCTPPSPDSPGSRRAESRSSARSSRLCTTTWLRSAWLPAPGDPPSHVPDGPIQPVETTALCCFLRVTTSCRCRRGTWWWWRSRVTTAGGRWRGTAAADWFPGLTSPWNNVSCCYINGGAGFLKGKWSCCSFFLIGKRKCYISQRVARELFKHAFSFLIFADTARLLLWWVCFVCVFWLIKYKKKLFICVISIGIIIIIIIMLYIALAGLLMYVDNDQVFPTFYLHSSVFKRYMSANSILQLLLEGWWNKLYGQNTIFVCPLFKYMDTIVFFETCWSNNRNHNFEKK